MTTQRTAFFTQLEMQFAQRVRSDAQKSAWQRFCALGLPQKSEESYRYLSLQSLYAASFAFPQANAHGKKEDILPHCQGALLVFINGFFVETWSDLSLLPPDSFTWEMGSHDVENEKDPMAALCAALCCESRRFVVHKDPGVPIHILHVMQGKEPTFVPLRFEIDVRSGVSVQCIFSSHGLGESHSHCSLATVICSLEENAKMQLIEDRTHWKEGISFDQYRFTLKKKSALRCKHLSYGGVLARREILVQLLGEESVLEWLGCDRLKGRAQMHSHVHVAHKAPCASSMQRFKGVLWDQAQLSFEGKITVARGAQKTDAYQRSDSLLLSPQAVAKTKPNLAIYADDVKASHGTTIAKVDPLQIFYFQSRGVSSAQAEELIAQGFCRDVVVEGKNAIS